MFQNLSYGRVVGAWFVAIAVTTIANPLFGPEAMPGTRELLFLIALLPPAVVLARRRAWPPAEAEAAYPVRGQGGR